MILESVGKSYTRETQRLRGPRAQSSRQNRAGRQRGGEGPNVDLGLFGSGFQVEGFRHRCRVRLELEGATCWISL